MSDFNEPAIIVKDVKKSFRIPLDKVSGIKQIIVNVFKRKKGYREFNALNGVSFEIQKGEFFGIVGRNGSGKSTLLKILAGVYTPDSGGVAVNGSLTPFIELGVGFNPELSGRENVFLNGALLGFSRKEMGEMYDDIVDFAELHDFMEERLKNYSSGMQVRLAFSIAIRARSDILLLDEVLAVGDANFQQKCFDYFDQLKQEKKTIVFISHDMEAIKKYCTNSILISNGEIIEEGDPIEIANTYERLNNEQQQQDLEEKNKWSKGRISVRLFNNKGDQSSSYSCGDELTAEISWNHEEVLNVKNVGVSLFHGGEYIFGTNTLGEDIDVSKGRAKLKVKLQFGDSKLRMAIGLFGNSDSDVIEYEPLGPVIKVRRDSSSQDWQGLIPLEYRWEEG